MSRHTVDDFQLRDRVVVEIDPSLGTVGKHGAITKITPSEPFPIHVELDRGGLHIYEPFHLLLESEHQDRPARKRRKGTR